MQKAKIFIISGPSGAGEDSIIKGLQKQISLEVVVSTTTRKMRPGESQRNPYWFISQKEFIERRDKGEFVEWAKQYNGNLYGVTKEEISRVNSSGRVGIWKVDYKGVIAAKKLFPKIIAIFITVPSLDILEERIRKRGGLTEAKIRERMEYTEEWMKHEDIYDYKIINKEGKLDEAVSEAAEIIKKHIDNG